VTEFAQERVDSYETTEGEPPELLGRNLNSAAHMLASATAFFFLAFLFAYLYLRSLNNDHLWHPKGVKPSLALGTLIMLLTVGCAGIVRLCVVDQAAGRRTQWRLKGLLALLVGLGAIAAQIVEWGVIGFGPADGGYASVFFGWTAFNVLFLAITLFTLENLVATAYRYRNAQGGIPPSGEASGDPGRPGHDISDPLSLLRPGLTSLSFYLAFLAALGVLLWVVLYLA
jgi:heme/copper-type cytochrome/quinol oxidase subunit 3